MTGTPLTPEPPPPLPWLEELPSCRIGAEATIFIPADAARMFAARSISLKELFRRSPVMAGGVLVTTDLRKP